MDVQYRCCCGIDVHKETVMANLLRKGVDDKESTQNKSYKSSVTKEG